MAQLDPGIVLKAFATPQLDIAGTLRDAEDRRRQQMLQQRQDEDYQRQQAAMAQQMQDAQDARGVIRQYGSDPLGARKAAFQTGNPDLVAKLDSMDEASRKRTIDIARGTAPLIMSLQKVPPQLTGQAMAQIAPELQARGWTPEHIAEVAQQLSDPRQRNAAFASIMSSAQTIEEYAKATAPYTLGEGERRFDGATNQMVAEGAPKFHAVTTPEGGTTTIFGAPDAGGGKLATNPGALKDGAFARSQPGYVGSSGGFAQFASPEQGIAAQEALLRGAYVGKGFNTISRIVDRYAPQGHENSGASVNNYKAYIAQRTGIDPNKPLTAADVPVVAAAMREFETGNRPRGPITIQGREKTPAAGKSGNSKTPQAGTPAYSQSAMDAFDRAIGSATRLLTHPGFEAAVGMPSINPFDGNLAGFIVPGSKAADFRAELDALKAQVFLPMVQSMKGMGALSDAEGKKLTASIGALDTNMSEGAFRDSLNRVIADLQTYKSRAAAPAGGNNNVIRYDAQGNRIK